MMLQKNVSNIVNKLSFYGKIQRINSKIYNRDQYWDNNRWYKNILSVPEDEKRLVFINNEINKMNFALKMDYRDLMKHTSLSTLNKFIEQHSYKSFGINDNEKHILRNIHMPKTFEDVIYQNTFLNEIDKIINVSQKVGNYTNKKIIDKENYTFPDKIPYPIIQSIGHISSALIPNCISILFNSNTQNITLDDIIKEQLTILGITYYYKINYTYLTNTLDLIKYVNDKKLSLCLYNNKNIGLCNKNELEIINYLSNSQFNHIVNLEDK